MVNKIPGDWSLGLEYPTCEIDNKPCPSYFSRCDKCKRNETTKEDTNVKVLLDISERLLEASKCEMKYAKESIFDCIQLINAVANKISEK